MSDHDARRDALRAARILLDSDVLPDEAEDVIRSDEPFKQLAVARFAVSQTARTHDGSHPDLRDLHRTEHDLDEMLRDRLGHLLRSNQIEIPNREDRLSVVEEVGQ